MRPSSELLTVDEIEALIRVMASLGIKKVRLTGGEPTLHPRLEEIVGRIAAIPGMASVAMTSNGVRFGKMAKPLRNAGLTSVNISLDSLNRSTFAKLTRRDDFERVMASIESALAAGFAPLKLNVVVIPGVNDHELVDFVELTRHRHVNVRFIEHMPFKANLWQAEGFVDYAEMKRRIDARYELHLLPETCTENRVAEDYKIPGFVGTVSFIASMSKSFCAYCSRIRLTAEGAFKACLFLPAQVNLRDLLRRGLTEPQLAAAVRDAVLAKWQGHPAPHELMALNDLSMIEIGG